MPGWFKKTTAKLKGALWKNHLGSDRVQLAIKFDAPIAPELWLEQLEDEKQYAMLPLKAGEARAWCRPGMYSLGYRGNTSEPKQKYAIEITGPTSAKWKPDPAELSDPNARINNYHLNFNVK